MGHLFSRYKHSSRITVQDEATLQLKQQRDKLNQINKKIEIKLANDRILAKRLVLDGKKDKALLLLKKKIYLENNLQKGFDQLTTIERLIDSIEFAQLEVRVVDGLKAGNDALKNIQKVMSLDDAERIMSDAQDSLAYQKELDEIVSGGLTLYDTAKLEDELMELVHEGHLDLPDVPTHALPDSDFIKTKDSKLANDYLYIFQPMKHRAKRIAVQE